MQQRSPATFPSQPVSTLLSKTNAIPCPFSFVNNLIGGGLQRGHILEISGPPGSLKESIALGFVRAIVESGQEVIFVGKISENFLSTLLIHDTGALDMQSMVNTYVLEQAFKGTSYNFPCNRMLYTERPTSTDSAHSDSYKSKIRYIQLHTLSDLMIFMCNLLTYIQPNVSNSHFNLVCSS